MQCMLDTATNRRPKMGPQGDEGETSLESQYTYNHRPHNVTQTLSVNSEEQDIQ